MIPPNSGPAATAKPTVEPQIAIAFIRAALELGPDQRQRRREERGAADALQRPRHVKRRHVPGDTAEERGRGEEEYARGKHEPAPVAIRERAGGQDQRRETDRVRIDDPLQAR